MPLNNLLRSLLERFQALGDTALYIGFDEAQNWPEGALNTLMESRLIAQAPPAKFLVCEECEEDCPMRVRIIPGDHPRAFIMCGDVGRVPVDLKRLQQWQMSETAVIGVLLALCNEYPVTEQLIREKLPTLPLQQALSFQQGKLLVDAKPLLPHLLPETATQQLNRITLTGDHWAITYHGQTKTFNNTKGLRYIAWLVQNQGKEVSVGDLYYAINPTGGDATDAMHSHMTTSQLDEMGLSVGDLGDAGDALTPEGKKRFRQAISRIKERIEEADEFGDDEKVAELQQQREEILNHLATETGLGGKPRKASSAIERVRTSVTMSISRAKEKIAKELPDLGQHLNIHLVTGTQCKYSPSPPVDWAFKDK